MEAKEIIKNIHAQWLVAKEQHRQRCEASGMSDVAQKLAVCKMFKGTEDLAEIAQLFTSPQGMEFCLATGFPNLATLRLFKSFKPQRFGVYLDAGQITLHNPERAILIGRTNATIHCDTCARHEVVAMHGATATVLASKWAVVRTQSAKGATITNRASDNAIILC